MKRVPVAPILDGHRVHLVRYTELDITVAYGMDEAGYDGGDGAGGPSDARAYRNKTNSEITLWKERKARVRLVSSRRGPGQE